MQAARFTALISVIVSVRQNALAQKVAPPVEEPELRPQALSPA